MSQETVRKVVDLKGHQCPFTFVLTKAHLEEMDSGILEVIVDYPPSAENIPRSVTAQDLGEIISVEHIEGKIWQLRVRNYRILYFAFHNKQFVLLRAFMKKTNKTPRREIEIAKSRLNEYTSRFR